MKKKFYTHSRDIPHYTKNGFAVVKCPESIGRVVLDLYKMVLEFPIEEENTGQDDIRNHSQMLSFNRFLGTVKHIHDTLLPLHEQWSGQILEPSAVWGIRSYTKGSTLGYHTDRPLTHHISSIIMVDKDLDGKSDWPLSIQGHDGKYHDIYTDPGDVILYESAACSHGRPEEFQGKYFRNFYMHYAVRDLEYIGLNNRHMD